QPRALLLDRVRHGDARAVRKEPQDDRLSERTGAARDDRDASGHCSGDREAGFDRGWPETDAAWLRTAMLIAVRSACPAWSSSSLGRGGHDRGALDLVVADLADVELLEVVAQLLEGLLERRKRLARTRERGRARGEAVLDVGMVDPAALDLGHRDAERRVGGAHHVGPLRPRLDALGHALLQELVDPAQDRREGAAREPLVLFVEQAQGDEVRRLE